MTHTHYQGIVIGAGQGGGPLASALAEAGWKTALVERKHVGGTCVNEGCTPTKTMVASARVAHLARRAADYGVQTGEITVDLETVRQRKRDLVETFRSGNQSRLEETEGLELIFGEARFTGERQLEVTLNRGGEQHLTADYVFINTGQRPTLPPLDGLEAAPYLTSTTIMELDAVPDHLLVLGGGYVGLEFAQMFRRFGSQVTLVQRGSQLLAREDEDVAEAVTDLLRDEGVKVLLDTEAEAVRQGAGGGLELTVEGPDANETLKGSHLLVAAGRTPNTEGLNVGAAGVDVDQRGNIVVNERLETTAQGVYALGDVKGGPAFTHISYDDYRIIKANVLDKANRTTNDRLVPYTIYLDPQLGRVGLGESEARRQGYQVKVAKLPMTRAARALETGETRGFMKAVVDADTKQLLGCAVLGVEGGEIMSVLQVAMMGKLPYPALRDSAFAHPTLAESLNNLFMRL